MRHTRLRSISIIAALILNPILCAAQPSHTMEWPHWRGPNRDASTTNTGLNLQWTADGPPVAWKADVGQGYSCVAIAGGRAYTMGRDKNTTDTVWCLNAETGKKIWEYSYLKTDKYTQPGDNGPASTPTIDGDRVYTLGLNGEFYCFDAATGKVRWSKNLMHEFGVKPSNYGFSCSPLITGEMVIVDVGRTLAFNKLTGDVIWKTKEYGASYSTPALIQFTVKSPAPAKPEAKAADKSKEQTVSTIVPSLAAWNGTGLVILKLADGSQLFCQEWSVPGINNVNPCTPIVLGDKAFVAAGYNGGWGLLDLTGDTKPAIVWKKQHESHLFCTPVYLNGLIYGFDATKLICLDFKTGDVKWKKPGLGKGTLILCGDKLIVLGEAGQLVVAEATPNAYKELARTKVFGPICWSVPALANGRLYLRNSKGQVVCMDLRAN